MCRALLVALAVCATLVQISSAASERKKIRPPLVEEAGRRKLQKQTHCQFGNHSYELEERWRPDLGPPFGMLFCMRCECIPATVFLSSFTKKSGSTFRMRPSDKMSPPKLGTLIGGRRAHVLTCQIHGTYDPFLPTTAIQELMSPLAFRARCCQPPKNHKNRPVSDFWNVRTPTKDAHPPSGER
ncbi:hypothetical protein JTE90_011501 [Oedothorax gibbosus]|uniref:Secreted protein n=1 Tax=Oedothorax gibbosus TaxID=931172 RepID=A0AAV6VE00_9ARAC|nr:hypothetical protein JTE90_011501 [Oedothorax gibbosus]